MGKGNKFSEFTYGVGLEITAQSFKQVKDDLKLNLDNLSKMVKSYGKVLKIDPDADLSKLFDGMRKVQSIVDAINSSDNSFSGFVDKGLLSRIELLENSLKTIDNVAKGAKTSLNDLKSGITSSLKPLKAASEVKFPAMFENAFGDIKDQSAKIKDVTDQIDKLSASIKNLKNSKSAFQGSTDTELDSMTSANQVKTWISEFKELQKQLSDVSLEKLNMQELEATIFKLSDLGQKLNSALLTFGEEDMKDLGFSLDGKSGKALNDFLLSIPKKIDFAITQIQTKRSELGEQLEQLRTEQTKYDAKLSGQSSTGKSIGLQSDITAQVKITPKANDAEWANTINDTIKNIEPNLHKVHLTPTFSKSKNISKEIEGNLAQVNHAVNVELKVNDNVKEFNAQIENIDTSIKNAKKRLEENGNFRIRFQYEEGGNFKDVAYKIINQLQQVEVHVDEKTSKNFIKELGALRTRANKELRNISSTIKKPSTSAIIKDVEKLRSDIDSKIGNIGINLNINNEPQIISQATLIRDKLTSLYNNIPVIMGVGMADPNIAVNTPATQMENLSEAAKAASKDLELCRQKLTSLQKHGFNAPEFLQLGNITPDGKKIKGSEKELEGLLNKYKELKAKVPYDIADRWQELYPEANGNKGIAVQMANQVHAELKQLEVELNGYLQKQIAYTQSRYEQAEKVLQKEREINTVQADAASSKGNNKKLEKTRAELNSINGLLKDLQSNGFKSSEFLNLGDIGADGKKIDDTTKKLKRLLTEYNNLKQRTTPIKGAGQQQWFEKYPKAKGDISKVESLIAKDEKRMQTIESQLNPYVQKQIAFLSSRQASLQQILSAEEKITSEHHTQNKTSSENGQVQANAQLAMSAEEASKKVKSLTGTITYQKKVLKDLNANGINSASFTKVGEWDKQAGTFKKFSQETLQLIARYKDLKKAREDAGGKQAVGEEAQLRGKLGAILREQKKRAGEILALNQQELESVRAIVEANKGTDATSSKKANTDIDILQKQVQKLTEKLNMARSALSSLQSDGISAVGSTGLQDAKGVLTDAGATKSLEELVSLYNQLSAKKKELENSGTKSQSEYAKVTQEYNAVEALLADVHKNQVEYAQSKVKLYSEQLDKAQKLLQVEQQRLNAEAQQPGHKSETEQSASGTIKPQQTGAEKPSGIVKLDSATLNSIAKDGTLKSIDGKVGQILNQLGTGINITGSNISIEASNVSVSGSGATNGADMSSGKGRTQGTGGKPVNDEVNINTLSSYSRQLTAFEEQMKRSGLYTDQFKNKIAELHTQLNAVNVKDDFNTYKFDLDRFKEDFEKLKTYDSLYQKFVNSQSKQIQLHDQISTSNGPTEELRQQLQIQDEISRNLEDQLKQYTNLYDRRAQQLAIEEAIKKAYQEIITSEASQSDKDAKKQISDVTTMVNNAQKKYDDMQYTMSNFKVPMADGAIAKFKEYEQLLTTLKTKQQEINNNHALLNDESYSKNFDTLLKQMRVVELQFTNLTTSSERFLKNIRSTDDIQVLGSTFDVTNMSQMHDAMINFANTTGLGTAKLIEFNDAQRISTFEINDGKGHVHQLTVEYDAATNSLGRYISKTKEHVSETQKFINSIKHSFHNVARYLASFGSVYRIFAIIRQGFTYIKDIDTALTELKKVTDETDASYKNFLQDMSNTGSVVGATVKELTTMASEWARLGYSMEEAGKLAKSTAILLNVSEFEDATKASEALISTMQAFQYTANESQHVVDILNEVGNNYAVSSDGIATALQDSASALMAAGNNLEQSVALVASANRVVQDPNSVGSALRTISLRLRGTSVEVLEEIGEETEGVIESTSKLQSKIQALSGVNILTDAGDYKDTYTVLKEIGTVWEDMSDIDQAALLELMAGKNRANTLSAILSNMTDLEGAYNDALNAEGSALKENQAYLDSIQGKIDLFNNSTQTMWMNLINSETIKDVVDFGTSLIKLADDIGVVNIALTAFAMRMSSKFFKIDFAHPIKSVKDLFETIKGGTTIASNNLDVLKKSYEDAKNAYQLNPSQDNLNAFNAAKINLETYQQEATEAIRVSNNLKEAQEHLANAQNRLNNYTGNSQKELDKLQDDLRRAQKGVEDATEANRKFEQSGTKSFANVGKKIEGFVGQIQSAVASMLIMMAITKAIDLIGDIFDKNNESAEEAKESFDDLTSELSNTKSKLKDLESELSNVEDHIAEINQSTPLSFTDQEDLERLRAESEELKRQIEYTKILEKQQQFGVNQSAVNAIEKYKQTGKNTGKTASENISSKAGSVALVGAGVGTVAVGSAAAGIGSAVLGAKAGTAIGTAIAPVIGTLIGAAVGALAGAIVGTAIGGIESATDETIGETMDNMTENYERLQSEMQTAREKYTKSGNEKDQKKYEEALKSFNNYQAEMATYMAEMDAMYSQIDWDTATEEERKAMQEFYNQRDKWAIISGGNDAKVNAIDRLFGEGASEVVRAYRDKIKNDIKNGEAVDFQEMINVTGLDDDLEAIGLTTQDVADYFTKLGEAGADAVEKIDFSDVVSELAKVEGALESVQSVIEEFQTDGIVSASTLEGLDESIKNLDAFDAYAEALMSGTATMVDVKAATEKLAKEYLESNANNITNDNKLTYIAQLEKFGIENAKELVESYIKQDFFDITNIQSATTGFRELSDKIDEAADAYEDIIEKDTTWSKGNVDYSKRPIVSAETMQKKYPEFDGDHATTYDMDKSLINSDGNIAATVKVTPILEDGTVIDEKTLTEYVEGVLQDAYNKGGLEGVLEADKNGYNIVIATTTEKVEYDDNGFSVLDKALQGAKDAHLELVNTSAQELIDLAAEKDIVLELADAYKILQAEEEVRAKQAKRDSEVSAKAAAEYRNKKKQETADALRDPATDARYKEFQYLFENIRKIENREGYFKNYTEEQAEQSINSYKKELASYLKKYGYTLEDAFPTFEVVPEITVSQEEVDSAKKEYQALLDQMNLTVTPEIDLDPRNQIENMSDWEDAIKSLSGVYNELLDDGKVSAGSLVGLADTFDIVGAKEEYEEFVNILSTAKSDTPEVRDAFENLTAAYLVNSGALEDVTEETEAMTVAKLKEMGVVNAEAVAHKALIINQMQNITSIERLKTATDEQIESEAEVMAALSAEAGAALTTADAINTLKYYRELYNIEDITSVTADEANSLLALATSAGIAKEELVKLEQIKDFIANKGQMKSDFFKSKNPGNNYVYASMAMLWEKEFEKTYSEQLKQLYAGVGTEYTPPNFEEIIRNSLGGLDFSGLFGDAANGGSGSDNEIDWLDHYFTAIENEIKEKEAELEHVTSSGEGGLSAKNTIIDEIISLYESKMSPLETAMNAYQNRASTLFNSFSSEIQDKILNGSIDINEYDGDLAEDIQNYFDYLTRVSDIEIEIGGIKATITDLSIQQIDNAYDSGRVRATVEASQTEKLQNAVDFDEARGVITDPSYYAAMMENSSKTVEYLTTARTKMQKEFDDMLRDGMFTNEDGSYNDLFYQEIDKLYKIDAEIAQATIDIENFQNAINDIYWESFDEGISRFKYLSNETQSLIDLMSSEDMIIKPDNEDGWGANDVTWSDEGLATLGLHAQQMERAEEESQWYAQAIQDLTAEYEAGHYSESEYYEKLDELTQGQYNAIKAAQDEKDAIVELNKQRVDAIKDGIEKEIDAYDELIKKKKEELSAEKDLYDFQQDTTEKQKDIADIKRKLAALANDNSMSAAAQRRKLEAELAEANADLEDSYYNRSVDNQQEALDNEFNHFKEQKEAEIEQWDKYLEDVENLVAESLGIVKANAEAIGQTLTDKSSEYGVTVSDAVLKPWTDGLGAIDNYTKKIGDSVSPTVTALEPLREKWQKIKEEMAAANAEADKYYNKNDATKDGPSVEDINAENADYHTMDTPKPDVPPQNNQNNNNANTNNNTAQSNAPSLAYGSSIKVKASATHFGSKSGNARMASFVPGGAYTVYQTSGDQVLIGRNGAYTGWIKKTDIEGIEGFYKGTTGTRKNQLAWIDELGEELVMHADGRGKLAYLTKGSAVIPHDISENLMRLGQLDPSTVLEQNRPKITPSKSIINTEIRLDCSVGTMVNIERCDQNTLPDVEKLVHKAFDRQMQNLNNSLRKFAR